MHDRTVFRINFLLDSLIIHFMLSYYFNKLMHDEIYFYFVTFAIPITAFSSYFILKFNDNQIFLAFLNDSTKIG